MIKGSFFLIVVVLETGADRKLFHYKLIFFYNKQFYDGIKMAFGGNLSNTINEFTNILNE